jgi:hypothetical protein
MSVCQSAGIQRWRAETWRTHASAREAGASEKEKKTIIDLRDLRIFGIL